MNKITYKVSVFAILFLAISFGVFSCNVGNKEPSKIEKVSLRLQWFHLAQFAGFYAAEDNGFYKNNKIDITINPGGPDFNAITLVSNGSETFGVWTADQLLIAQSNGVPITIIAAIYRDDPNILMVKEESNIKTPYDFKGKSITTVYGRSTETVLKALLQKVGISEKEVNIEPFPFNVQSFLQGKIDVSAGYSYDHPYQAEKTGQKIRIINPVDYGIKFYSDCIFTRNDLIEKNPDLVKRFVAASIKGWEYALINKDTVLTSVLKRSPQLDRESQIYMLNAIEPLIKSENPQKIGLISNESIKKMVDILKVQKQLPDNFDPSKSFTNKFIEDYYDSKK